MHANEYQREAMRTAGAHTEKDLLIDGVMGLAGESGECVDLVKKHLFQGHALDEKRLAEELGDVAWYMAITAFAINYPLAKILHENVKKLQLRYPNGFDPQRSRKRDENG